MKRLIPSPPTPICPAHIEATPRQHREYTETIPYHTYTYNIYLYILSRDFEFSSYEHV